VIAGEGSPADVVTTRKLAIVSDENALAAAVNEAINANPDIVDKIKSGKTQAAGALIGSVMKQLRGQADAARVRELILEKIG
jgi:aspartyl-tRNA(Asn)/glutamyl-tRNA(Gln) amidotransferase subunit B